MIEAAAYSIMEADGKNDYASSIILFSLLVHPPQPKDDVVHIPV